MLYIDNIRIYKVDEYNYSYEVYKEKTKKDGIKEKVWVKSNSYFGTLDNCLKSIKDKVIKDLIKTNEMNVEDFIYELEKLHNCYVKLSFIVDDSEANLYD